MLLGAVRSHGQHAVPRRRARRALVAALSVPVLCEGLLLAGGLSRAVPRLARLAGSGTVTAVSWLLLAGTCASAGLSVAEAMEPDVPGTPEAITATLACVAALAVLHLAQAAARARGRQRWRETGGRMVPPGPLTGAERAYQFSRLDTLEATQRRVLERLDAQDEAWAIWAEQREGDDTRPHLWVIPGGDSA